MMYEPERMRRLVLLNQTQLYFMIQNLDWEGFRRRARSHPQELDVQDEGTGNTLLHEACRRDPPPDVIQTLQAVSRVKNHQGATPLHIAASHRCSAQALSVLLECAETLHVRADSNADEASDQNNAPAPNPSTTNMTSSSGRSPTTDLSNMGRAPIHYACMSFRGLEIDAFLVLLDATLRHGNLTLDQEDDSMMPDDEDEFDEEIDIEYLLPTQEIGAGKDAPRVVNVMSMKDATGKTPLELLFRKYKQRVRSIITKLDRLRREHGERSTLASAITVHAELGELWEKARRIVARLTQERLLRESGEVVREPPMRSPGETAVRQEAAAWSAEQHRGGQPREEDILPVYACAADRESSSSPNPRPFATNTAAETYGKCHKFRIVHASVGLIGYGCPPEMIRLAVAIHPHQVREMDEDGNLPIHIAAKASSYLADQSSATNFAAAAGILTDADDRSVISDAMSFFSSASISQTTNPFDKVIKILLQYYPEAARIPQGQTGNLPLVEAIEAGRRSWNDGIRTLLHAYPPALHDKKLVGPKVYPSLLALITSGSPDLGREDCIDFGLLRRTSKTAKQRHDMVARTTIYELLRTRPEWLPSEECQER